MIISLRKGALFFYDFVVAIRVTFYYNLDIFSGVFSGCAVSLNLLSFPAGCPRDSLDKIDWQYQLKYLRVKISFEPFILRRRKVEWYETYF